MATQPDRPHRGNLTPEELADPTLHRQNEVFETENRPDVPGAELPVGNAAGPDTTGAVAHPAALNKPGVSSILGGTPGANATGSQGRTGDYER